MIPFQYNSCVGIVLTQPNIQNDSLCLLLISTAIVKHFLVKCTKSVHNRSSACCQWMIIIIHHHHNIRRNFNNCPKQTTHRKQTNKHSLKHKLMTREAMLLVSLARSNAPSEVKSERSTTMAARHLDLLKNGIRADSVLQQSALSSEEE